ncbi:MAG: hypothetical protein WC683_07430 [bacterium]
MTRPPRPAIPRRTIAKITSEVVDLHHRITTLYEYGYEIGQISQGIGVSRTTVRRHLKIARLDCIQQMVQEGRTILDIQETVGIPAPQLLDIIQRIRNGERSDAPQAQ